jgi:hypothetical protein
MLIQTMPFHQESHTAPVLDVDTAPAVPPILSEVDDGTDGLSTQGFVYEEPSKSYWEKKKRLDDLGAFSYERWEEMDCIHFILPNMGENGQACTVRTARVPHFQTPLSKMESEVASFRQAGGIIKFKSYHPNRNYSNTFLHLNNLDVRSTIDWNALARLASKASKGGKKRQQKYKDFGTTAGQCTTRVGSIIGVAKPSFKPGTKETCIEDAMLALCCYTQHAKYKWMPKGLRPFNCDDKDDKRNKFAQRFRTDCFIPASQVGLINIKNPWAYHRDDLNECVPTLSRVVVVNRERSRCALIGYSRRSVDEYLVRADVHGTSYTGFICDEYNLFLPD